MKIDSSLRATGGMLIAAALILATGFQTQDDDRGKVVFETVCSACHSLVPPADLAPPMLMVAGHYVDARKTDEAAMASMREWLKEPAEEKSLLPAHAIEKFGLMPPLTLPQEDIDAVVKYIFAQRAESGSPEPGSQPHDMQMMHRDSTGMGMGMMRGRMNMSSESTGTGMGMGMMHGQMGMGSGSCADGQCKMHQQDGEQGMTCPMHADSTAGKGMQHRHGNN